MEDKHDVSALQQCSKRWVTELSRIAEDLNGGVKHIQAEFARSSERAVSRDQDPIPDLVRSIRRILQLEATMTHLRLACQEISAKRNKLLPVAYEQLMANQELLSVILLEMKVSEPIDVKWDREELQDQLRAMLFESHET